MAYTQRFPIGAKEHSVADLARASLNAGISDSSETIVLADTVSGDDYDNFPQGNANNEAPFVITIESEKILIFSRSGATLTVYNETTHGLGYVGAGLTGRGYDGSSASAHVAGTVAYLNVTKKVIEEIIDAIASCVHKDGGVDFTGDQDFGGNAIESVKYVELEEQASDPSNVANNGHIYTKEYNSKTELYFENDAGEVLRITNGGSLNTSVDLSANYDWTGDHDFQGGFELDSVALTSDASELNKLDGAGATVTAGNLDTLTDGSNADSLHIHGVSLSAGENNTSGTPLSNTCLLAHATAITNSTSYVKLVECTAGKAGTIATNLYLSSSDPTDLASARIYKNGVAYGTERTTSSNNTWNENLSFSKGDLIQVYAKIRDAHTAQIFIRLYSDAIEDFIWS